VPKALNLVTRLFLLVGLTLAPAIVLLAVSEVELRAQRTAAAQDQAVRLARDASARLGRFIEGLREALVVLSEAPVVRELEHTPCTSMLMALRGRFPDQIILGAVRPDGWLICTTAGTPDRLLNVIDRSFFRLAVANNDFAVSEWEAAAAILRGGSIHFGLPIRGAGGEPAGVVGAAVGVDHIGDLLRAIRLPAGADLTVVDREHRVLLRLSDRAADPVRQGQPAPPALLRLLPPFPPAPGHRDDAETGAHAMIAEDEAGERRILGVASNVPGTGGALRLAVSLDARAALAPVEAAGLRGALLIVAGLALALAAAYFGARRFVLNPVARLLDGAERWSAGEYGVRVAPGLVRSTPELYRLGAELDRMAEVADGRDRAAAALAEERARLGLALEAGGLAAWELDQASGEVLRSPRHDALFGYPQPRRDWSWRTFLAHVLPEDRDQAKRVFRRALRGAAPLTLEFRIRRAGDGEIRWLEALGALHRTPDGAGKFLGVMADVTERRRSEQRLRLAVGELNHRVKNTLAAVQSIAAEARAAFEARLLALARSHDVLTREGWTGVELGELVALALAPHGGGGAPRHSAFGPPLRVPPRFAVPLGIALHELATNAARHGALKLPAGRVEVSWRLEPSAKENEPPILHLRWAETGGPPVLGPPAVRGFGTRLLERGLARELGGTVRLRFHPDGVVCEIAAALRQLGYSPATAVAAAAQ
jgi:PAS domain S-box-containing protein